MGREREGNGQLKAKGAAECGGFSGFGLNAARNASCVQADVRSQHALSACLCCARQHAGAISSTLQRSGQGFREGEVASPGAHSWLCQR